ncbi:sensor histidine kinase [Rhodococcus rhodnii]|uniref:histidine kinase n=1 Tax=Rhodococcus rhodnii LMG 5362 TaxID=1273125 RepID=R7WPA7_9NOCA|nr:sensor histidine kinase KdpD [Rhodococcus rhodnii]EOM77148.1 histidine sensor kinase [Rhodococcus rhodnii LMG 5362]
MTNKRGRLRVYLGAAPGVGKTYAMLDEAQRLRALGCDVVTGVVETHGRARTAERARGLDALPPIEFVHRGITFAELDVEAVTARDPDLVLVDEFAHTNAPGSRNGKRWQDVEEILDAGIDVFTTVNIQHLESLADVVARITGVVQRETVPDAVVRAATQVELVDLTPEALRARLTEGDVYAASKVDAALSNYFRTGNLTALRELALLWTADQVDAALAKYRADNRITATWETRERVVVAVTGGEETGVLIRRSRRIASRSGAELLVVHVVRGDGLAGADENSLAAMRTLAADVGASVHTVVGDDVPRALLDFARSVNATQLVVGTSRRSRWARLIDEGIGAAVVRGSGTIDVHTVTHDARSRARWPRPRPGTRGVLAWCAAVAVPAAASALMYLVDDTIGLVGESALFVLVVLAVALLGGVVPAALSALVSGVMLNYLFTEPVHSLTISDPANVVTIVALLLVAVAVAALVDLAATRERTARAATREAELLGTFAAAVLYGADLPALLERLRETYGQREVAVVSPARGVLGTAGEDPPTDASAADTITEVDASAGTAGGTYSLLLRGPELTGRDRRVLAAVAHHAVALVERDEMARQAREGRALVEGDRLRRALLSAVGHDLRTPLAAVKAAVSSLRSDDVDFSPEDTAELLATIEESADALTDLVANLLDSSRLAAGALEPAPRTVYLDEVVHRALAGIDRTTAGYGRAGPSRVHVDVGAATAYADPGLLERAVANLVDNALRHGGGSEVRVSAATLGERALLTVADSGPGLPAGHADAVFEPFQRRGDRDTSSGVGLGLSVVRGFVEAMGGTVSATPTPGGGTTMAVDLPAAQPHEHEQRQEQGR